MIGKMTEDFEKKNIDSFPENSQEYLKHLDSATQSYSREWKYIDELEMAKSVLLLLKNTTHLAIDCEGVRLGRDGKLTLIQVAAENNTVYLFDVLALGQSLFDNGMKDLLENSNIIKYMFDCRKDSSSLYHEYSVKLTNVIDLQLYEFIVRLSTGNIVYNPKADENPLSRETKVAGLRRAVKVYVSKTEIKEAGLSGFFELKGAGDQLMNSERTLWRYRPLSEGMSRYAAMDIEMIWILHKKLHELLPLTENIFEQVKIGSEIYVSMRRDADVTPKGKYINNAILAPYVIPKVIDGQVQPHPVGDKRCNGCRRNFPSEFIIDGEDICEHCKNAINRHKKPTENSETGE